MVHIYLEAGIVLLREAGTAPQGSSWRIIEKLGGQLECTIWDDEEQEMIRRYWVRFG